MKTKVFLAACALATLGLASCSGSDAKLAGDVVGTWKGETTQMISHKKDMHHKDGHRGKAAAHDVGEMTCTPTINFVRTQGTNGGTLTITGDYSMTKSVESVASATPVNATVNGTVSASGTWNVKDGDEIKVSLDPAKTDVTVDTASLVLKYATLTDAPQDSLVAMKERLAANVSDIIVPMMKTHLQKLHEFDDVTVTGTVMTMEMGHSKMTLNKQK